MKEEKKPTDNELKGQIPAPPEEEAEGADARVDENDDYSREILRFRRLFGQIDPDSIPDAVWDRVKEGHSLCAEYALHLYEVAAEESRIRDKNEQNDKSAPGKITSGGGEEYFSPEAVRAMDGKAVRKNYEKIMRSMEHWN